MFDSEMTTNSNPVAIFDLEPVPRQNQNGPAGNNRGLKPLKQPADQRSRDLWSANSFDSVQRSPRKAPADGSQEYIAVSCAGGGARSQSFCTGVLATLYETDNITVTTVSTVSGGGWAGVGLELWRQAAIDKGLDPRIETEWIYEFILHTTEKSTGEYACLE